MSKNKPAAKKNPPDESRQAELPCPSLGHVENEQKYGIASKATPLAT